MRLDRIALENFRNYAAQQVGFDPVCNVICGENAQGKTNLLEAMVCLSMGKSHRTRAPAAVSLMSPSASSGPGTRPPSRSTSGYMNIRPGFSGTVRTVQTLSPPFRISISAWRKPAPF